jgi:glycosyltransferase involved in cell wall biosynthesis
VARLGSADGSTLVAVPQVTAAIATYNRAAYLTEAVESALAQGPVDVEVIVVDDGSTDGTSEALEPYLDRIEYVRQANAGRAAARNAAIRRARGTYVAFLDSDDIWLPGKLERQVRFMEAHPTVGLTHGHSEVMDEHGHTLARETEAQRRAFQDAHRSPPTYAAYARRCLCLTSTTMVRRDVFDRIGVYDDSVALVGHSVTGEDLDLYLRLALDSEIAFLDGPPLARYRMHELQTPLDELTLGEIAVCRKHLELLAGRPGAQLAERLALQLRLLDCNHRLANGPATRRAARDALALDPRLVFSPPFLRRLGLGFVPRRVLRQARGAKQSLERARRT